eukprot:1607947-Pleurochrysis_carterae.AAC.3
MRGMRRIQRPPRRYGAMLQLHQPNAAGVLCRLQPSPIPPLASAAAPRARASAPRAPSARATRMRRARVPRLRGAATHQHVPTRYAAPSPPSTCPPCTNAPAESPHQLRRLPTLRARRAHTAQPPARAPCCRKRGHAHAAQLSAAPLTHSGAQRLSVRGCSRGASHKAPPC